MTQQLLFGELPNKMAIINSQIDNNAEMLTYLREKLKNGDAIYIPDNTPSLKNSKEIGQIYTKSSVCHNSLLYKEGTTWYCSKCKQPAARKTKTILRPSKTVLEFQKVAQYTFNQSRATWKKMIENRNPPYRVAFYFIRKSMHEFDYQNVVHVLADMMVNENNEWLKDDSMLYFMPEFLGYHHNNSKPGCIITIFDEKLNELKNNVYKL